MQEVDAVLTSYEAGQMKRDEMLQHSHAWQKEENRLRSEVAQLYLNARANDCL
jgi:hypothetical protein